jgi:hypothetical protein
MAYREEKTWVLRVTLEMEFDEDGDHPLEDHAWLEAWEEGARPAIVRAAFDALRAAGFAARVLARGLPAEDEIEILASRSAVAP